MTERTKKNLIKRIYFDLSSPAAYAGAEKVYQEAKKRIPTIRKEEVEDFLQSFPTYSIYRPTRKRFKRLATIASGKNSDWQADLAIFDTLRKNNDNYKYLLVAIDVLSRKMVTAPVRSKSPKDMIPAFDILFQKAKVKPHKIYSDRGLEFQSREMLEYFKKHGIQKNVMYSENIYAGLVERANRTIKERLYRYFHENKTHRWVDAIDAIVDAINNSVNRTTGIEPNKVTYQNAEAIREKLFGEHSNKGKSHAKPKYRVGDIIRISKTKGIFGKGYHPNYTLEKFRIKEAYQTNPPHYKIEDLNTPPEEILGVIYEPEISLVSKTAQQGDGNHTKNHLAIKPLLWEKL